MPLSWTARGAASAERMRRLMQMRGYTPNGHPLWERPEEGRVTGNYPNYRAVFIDPWRRTKSATYSKAGRLKITRPRGKRWDDNEIIRLRKIYPTGKREDILAAFPGRSWAAIAKQANSRGIYRAPKPYKSTGNRVLDQILERARARNVSMAELDQVSWRSARKYFFLRKWRGGRFDHVAHGFAVRFLGGKLRFQNSNSDHGGASATQQKVDTKGA